MGILAQRFRETDHLAPLAGRGGVARERDPGDGASPLASSWRVPLTPTLPPQAGRGSSSLLAAFVLFLPQQHRVGLVHGFGAVHHLALQRGCLYRNVFREKPRQRDVTLRVAGTLAEVAGGERLSGEHAAAERRAEQAEIRRSAGEGIVRRGSDALEQPPAGAC